MRYTFWQRLRQGKDEAIGAVLVWAANVAILAMLAWIFITT